MLVTKLSPISGKENTRDIPCTEADIRQWEQSRRPIQQILHWLSADDREFLMSGILPEEWDVMFQGMEGEGEDE